VYILVRGVPARASRRVKTGKEVRSGFPDQEFRKGLTPAESGMRVFSKASAPATVSGAGVSTSSPSLAFRVRLESVLERELPEGDTHRSHPAKTGLGPMVGKSAGAWETVRFVYRISSRKREFGLPGPPCRGRKP